MTDHPKIRVLAAIPPAHQSDYRSRFGTDDQLELTLASDLKAAHSALTRPSEVDVLVIDNDLGGAFESIRDLRGTHPNLLIVMVDQQADFSTPGLADEVSVDPFSGDDLFKRIKRLAEERRIETLRTDSFPPVRSFARALRRAGRGQPRMRAAVETIRGLGYHYVAYYGARPDLPCKLQAQVGPEALTNMAPREQDGQSAVGLTAQDGQCRQLDPQGFPNHPFIREQILCSGAVVPVGSTLRFGVLVALRDEAGPIARQELQMLELVSAQFASALAREMRT
jgi:GAF domain-containing protein